MADSEPESDDDELRKILLKNKLEIELKSREAVMSRITDNNEFIFDTRGRALKVEDVLTKEATNLRKGKFMQNIVAGPNVKVANKFRKEYVHPNRLPLVEVKDMQRKLGMHKFTKRFGKSVDVGKISLISAEEEEPEFDSAGLYANRKIQT